MSETREKAKTGRAASQMSYIRAMKDKHCLDSKSDILHEGYVMMLFLIVPKINTYPNHFALEKFYVTENSVGIHILLSYLLFFPYFIQSAPVHMQFNGHYAFIEHF